MIQTHDILGKLQEKYFKLPEEERGAQTPQLWTGAWLRKLAPRRIAKLEPIPKFWTHLS